LSSGIDNRLYYSGELILWQSGGSHIHAEIVVYFCKYGKMVKKEVLLYFLLFLVFCGCIDNKSNDRILHTDISPDYLDQYRPQIHYSRDTGWLSDPNGLFFLEGKWHLLFQGFSNREGGSEGTNWDHSTSMDLLHWENQPTVLTGRNQISYYSGCAVVDKNNLSDLGSHGQVPVLAFYTTHYMNKHPETPNRNKISIAHSLDNGITWSYGDKHVIENEEFPHERDPSVFWHKESKKWIMATAGSDKIRFYSSENLIDWVFESAALPYPSWECPDLTTIKVEETGEEKILLITSTNGGVTNSTHGTCYHVGTFDGHTFYPEDTSSKRHWLDWGSDFYAGITYSNAPDGRILFQSWFGWPCQWNTLLSRTTKFSGTMNLTRELTLHEDEKYEYYICSNPIQEYKKLRMDSTLLDNLIITDRYMLKQDIGSHDPLEFILEIKLTDESIFGIRLKNDFGEDYIFKYDDWHKHFVSDRTKAGTVPGHYSKSYNNMARMPYEVNEHQVKLHIFFDVSTFEVFIDNGREAFSEHIYPREPFSALELFVFSGKTEVTSLKMYELKSIWENPVASY